MGLKHISKTNLKHGQQTKDKLAAQRHAAKVGRWVLGEAHANNQYIGNITATACSPSLNSGVGYVRLAAPGSKLGEDIQIDGIDGETHAAMLLELPFYDKEKKISRGLEIQKI